MQLRLLISRANTLFLGVVMMSLLTSFSMHPIYLSVVEVEHNPTEKTLEISCKVYTDDMEKVLRQKYNAAIDLGAPAQKQAMGKFISDYVRKHLFVSTDDKQQPLNFLGYEIVDECVYSYFQAENVTAFKKFSVFNDMLYDYAGEQINIIHLIYKGERRSNKLVNPVNTLTIDNL